MHHKNSIDSNYLFVNLLTVEYYLFQKEILRHFEVVLQCFQCCKFQMKLQTYETRLLNTSLSSKHIAHIFLFYVPHFLTVPI